MNKLKLPRLISDGMVLQQKKCVRIWGEDEPGRTVMVTFLEREYSGKVNEAGEWEIFTRPSDAGSGYRMQIRDDAGEEWMISDIAVGDVFFCSGQSNMELPMEKVIDRYPEEIEQCTNKDIRTFKITENPEFHGPLKDHRSGEWKAVSEDTCAQFFATAYFFAKHMYQMAGVPIGLLDASLGGSRIESWMSRDMLEGYEDFLALADRYREDAYVQERLRENQRLVQQWHSQMDSMDIGLQENWSGSLFDVSDWQEIEIPFFFRDTPLKGFIGSVWFYQEFTVADRLAGKEARLWLGTIVDSDTVYINGVLVGHTDYQYPPRKYIVPEGISPFSRQRVCMRIRWPDWKVRRQIKDRLCQKSGILRWWMKRE